MGARRQMSKWLLIGLGFVSLIITSIIVNNGNPLEILISSIITGIIVLSAVGVVSGENE